MARCLIRMNDTIPLARVIGEILIGGENINDRSVDLISLRARIGIVVQKPNPFPKSPFETWLMDLEFMGWQSQGGA